VVSVGKSVDVLVYFLVEYLSKSGRSSEVCATGCSRDGGARIGSASSGGSSSPRSAPGRIRISTSSAAPLHLMKAEPRFT